MIIKLYIKKFNFFNKNFSKINLFYKVKILMKSFVTFQNSDDLLLNNFYFLRKIQQRENINENQQYKSQEAR